MVKVILKLNYFPKFNTPLYGGCGVQFILENGIKFSKGVYPCGTVYGSTNFLYVDNGDLTVKTVQYHKLWKSTVLTPDVYKNL